MSQSFWKVLKLLPTTFLIIFVLSSYQAQAADNRYLTYQGRILNPDNTPLESDNVQFTLKIYNPSNTCLLWQETKTQNMVGTSGVFSLNIGAQANQVSGGPATMDLVFSNAQGITGQSGCSYTPSATDDRNLVVSFTVNGTTNTLASMAIKAVPYANFSYQSAKALTADQIAGTGISATAPLNGQGLIYNSTSGKWEPTTLGGGSGTVTSITAGSGLTGGSITTSGTIAVDAGATGGLGDANKIAKLNASGQLPAAMIPTLNQNTTGTAANVTGTVAVANGGTGTSTLPSCTAGQALKYDGANWSCVSVSGGSGTVTSVDVSLPSIFSASSGAITSSGTISFTLNNQSSHQVFAGPLTGSAVPAFRSLQISDINSSVSGSFLNSVPSCSGSDKALVWVSANDQIQCQTISLASFTGSLSGDVSGTQSVTSVDKIKGKSISPAAYSAGQVLRYDGTNWVNAALSNADVTGLGLLATKSSVDLSSTDATGTMAAARMPALTGDVTNTAGSLSTTIANNAVTAAKMANGTITDTQVAAGAAIGWSKVSKSGAAASDVGAVANAGSAPSIQSGLDASKPSSGWTAGRLYIASDTKKIYYDTGAAWIVISSTVGSDISGNITGNAANVTGTVEVANGGTGATTLTANNVILGNGTSAVQVVAPGASGNVLTSNGTTWVSQAAAGGSGRTSCPANFTLIGTSGSAEAFCISSSQETSATWLNATTTCYNKSPKARLCSASEWAMACVAGASGPNNMTGHWEWVADLSGNNGQIMGYSGCDYFDHNVGGSYGSRCCFR